jgi:hypothetical protein
MLTGALGPTGDPQVFESIQTLYDRAQGMAGRSRHLTTYADNKRTGTSYEWVEGAWEPRRTYTWQRVD